MRAVILKDDKVLLIREGNAYGGGTNHGKYDFPGGKVHVGETVIDAINREVEEESGMKVIVKNPFFVDEWRPIIKDEQIQIIGIFFLCEAISEEVKLGTDHDDYQWVSVSESTKLPLIDATEKALNVLKGII